MADVSASRRLSIRTHVGESQPTYVESPCAAPTRRHTSLALLFRGEMYRSGCEDPGVKAQDIMMLSYYQLVAQSLEACGTAVSVFFTDDGRGCANSTLRERLRSWWPTGTAQHWLHVSTRTQPQSVRAALEAYASHAHKFDVLLLARYDVRLMQPLRSWPCYRASADVIGLASRCEQWSWRTWNCTNDQVFYVPRSRFSAFRDAMGEDTRLVIPEDARADTTCFAGATEGDGVARRGFGHGCWNALAARVGAQALAFCWPPRAEGALERNDFYRRWRHGTWTAW